MINNKSAAAYAKPHTMSGKAVTVEANPGVLPCAANIGRKRRHGVAHHKTCAPVD